MIDLIIWGAAVPWKAPRVVRRGPKTVGIRPEATTLWQAEVRRQVISQLPPCWAPLVGPVCLDVVFVREPPKSWSQKKTALALAGDVLPTTRPDRSNLLKALEDALGDWSHDGVGALLYRDDAQIVGGSTSQVYGERACVFVRCESMPRVPKLDEYIAAWRQRTEAR